MLRRRFLLGCLALAAACKALPRTQRADARRIAITMDDPSPDATPYFRTWEDRNRAILEQLAARRVQIMLFASGKRIDSADGSALLQAFEAAGHLCGNHSYSHRNYNAPAMTSEEYALDIERCERLLRDRALFRRRFRFPFLKAGDTVQKRDAMRAVLRERGYAAGEVTVDTSDWAYDRKLSARLKENPSYDLAPMRAAYLAHMLDRVHYYERLALESFGRSISHTLLTHHNLLNGLFLGDLIDALRTDGYTIVTPEEAYADPIFAMQPTTIPAGESLVWSLAHENARLRASLRYPGEDESYEQDVLARL